MIDIGFHCPHCNHRMDVKDSRPTTYRGKATVRRRRKCRNCLARLTTYEVIDDGTGPERDAMFLREVRRAHEALSKLIVAHDGADEDAVSPDNGSGGHPLLSHLTPET